MARHHKHSTRYGLFFENFIDLMPQLTRSEIAVYCVLCLHANPIREAWPSIDTMADLAGYSRPQTKRSLLKLLKLGLISKRGKEGKVVKYVLHVDHLNEPHKGSSRGATNITSTYSDYHPSILDGDTSRVRCPDYSEIYKRN